LAKLLRPFGVKPKVIRVDDGSTPRGYTREALRDAWERWLPTPLEAQQAQPAQQMRSQQARVADVAHVAHLSGGTAHAVGEKADPLFQEEAKALGVPTSDEVDL